MEENTIIFQTHVIYDLFMTFYHVNILSALNENVYSHHIPAQ